MIKLTKTLLAWGSEAFEAMLKAEIEDLGARHLPLQQGLSSGSYAIDRDLSVMLIGVTEAAGVIQVRVGIFYTGIIAGCNCADDPTPVDELSEYCELQLEIDKNTAETAVSLVES